MSENYNIDDILAEFTSYSQNISRNASVPEKYRLTILEQPTDIEAVDGSSVRFSLKAKGEELVYQWQYKRPGTAVWNKSVGYGNKTDTLKVEAARIRDNFAFRCIITDKYGQTAESDEVVLTVIDEPEELPEEAPAPYDYEEESPAPAEEYEAAPAEEYEEAPAEEPAEKSAPAPVSTEDTIDLGEMPVKRRVYDDDTAVIHVPVKVSKKAEAAEYDEEDDEDYYEDEEKVFRRPHFLIRALVALVFAVVSVAVFAWAGTRLSLDHGTAVTVSGAQNKLSMADKLDVFANNSTADALGDLAFIKKIYTIPAGATVAPAPIAASYGTVSNDNAAEVLEVIERARRSGLLDGQEVIFDPDAEFFEASEIRYYCDDTILVICWKQLVNGRICSCAEVKIADASQIRRKIVNDTFGSGERLFATELAASCNSVVAMNADFYGFRDLGLSIYQGQICRYETTCDVLYIDRNGDFLTQRKGSFEGREAIEQFIEDNGIQFSLAFGPVIVENGEATHLTDNYGGLGEMGMEYSRAGIGQVDTLHYLYMTVSHSDLPGFYAPRATVNEFSDIFAGFGVKTAYNLDGGQTGELVFDGEPYNHIDFGSERTVSDIIYFATALPEDQR